MKARLKPCPKQCLFIWMEQEVCDWSPEKVETLTQQRQLRTRREPQDVVWDKEKPGPFPKDQGGRQHLRPQVAAGSSEPMLTLDFLGSEMQVDVGSTTCRGVIISRGETWGAAAALQREWEWQHRPCPLTAPSLLQGRPRGEAGASTISVWHEG